MRASQKAGSERESVAITSTKRSNHDPLYLAVSTPSGTARNIHRMMARVDKAAVVGSRVKMASATGWSVT